jgi:hypothetical protein
MTSEHYTASPGMSSVLVIYEKNTHEGERKLMAASIGYRSQPSSESRNFPMD